MIKTYRFLTLCLAGIVLGGAGCNDSRETSAPADSPRIGVATVAPEARRKEAILPSVEPIKTPSGTFTVKPYLQLGNFAAAGDKESLLVLWHAPDSLDAQSARWAVETRPSGTGPWHPVTEPPDSRLVDVPGVDAHRVWSAVLTDLTPGALFDYRISKNDTPVFTARGRARRSPGEPHRFVAVGDTGAGNSAERKIVYQISLAKPDFVFITGDIVYERGRASEYQERFFPIYNADSASPETGAPLLRSTLTLAAPGNHDTAYRNLQRYPDGLAYFMYWAQPLNGPSLTEGAPNTAALLGPETMRPAFLTASGSNYPRMTNFSFDYGGVHWTVLDSNPYVDWSDHALRAWVEKDLTAARNARWRFVAYHHPPFNSAKRHREAQQMRVLSDLFEKYKVDVVWNGHVHNYQRSFPLRFSVKKGADGVIRDPDGRVDGDFIIDKAFDGKTKTKPDGIIYLVTGGGGAGLHNTSTEDSPARWLPFTSKYIGAYSFTVVDVEDKKLSISQVGVDGKERDHFVITK